MKVRRSETDVLPLSHPTNSLQTAVRWKYNRDDGRCVNSESHRPTDTAAGSARNTISWHHQQDDMQEGGEVLVGGSVLS